MYDPPVPSIPEEVQKARAHFLAWVLWYLEHRKDRAPSRNVLAKKIGISGPSLSLLINATRGPRSPSFETLIGFSVYANIPVHVLLTQDPPDLTR